MCVIFIFLAWFVSRGVHGKQAVKSGIIHLSKRQLLIECNKKLFLLTVVDNFFLLILWYLFCDVKLNALFLSRSKQ